jgi:hypothetical protein
LTFGNLAERCEIVKIFYKIILPIIIKPGAAAAISGLPAKKPEAKQPDIGRWP